MSTREFSGIGNYLHFHGAWLFQYRKWLYVS